MSCLAADGRIRSVISFNRGGTWRQLSKPENVDCGKQFQRVCSNPGRHISYFIIYELVTKTLCPCAFCHQCNLHIHGEHSRNNRIVPMLALSEPTAVGLVIAHGD